jgi:hypothetical protein
LYGLPPNPAKNRKILHKHRQIPEKKRCTEKKIYAQLHSHMNYTNTTTGRYRMTIQD